MRIRPQQATGIFRLTCLLRGWGLYESSRAVSVVDGLPRAPSVGKSIRKNEDISASVCSIDIGAVFRPRLGQDLSRDVLVMSILLF